MFALFVLLHPTLIPQITPTLGLQLTKPLHPLPFSQVLPPTYTVDVTSGTTTCQSDVTISVNQRDLVSIDSTACDSIQWDGNWLASTRNLRRYFTKCSWL